jgi:hypothetical protein
VAPGVAGDVASLHSDGNNLTKQMPLNEKGEALLVAASVQNATTVSPAPMMEQPRRKRAATEWIG